MSPPLVPIGTAWPARSTARSTTLPPNPPASSRSGPATLRLLAWFAAPVVPLLFALQAANWWLFRGRTGQRYW
jgi:hypothetical protein